MRIGVFVKLILRYLTFFEWLRNTAYNVINNTINYNYNFLFFRFFRWSFFNSYRQKQIDVLTYLILTYLILTYN